MRGLRALKYMVDRSHGSAKQAQPQALTSAAHRCPLKKGLVVLLKPDREVTLSRCKVGVGEFWGWHPKTCSQLVKKDGKSSVQV
jgi:hypothetical protein